MDENNSKPITEKEFHETLAIMAEQIAKLPTREEVLVKEDARQIVKEEVKQVIKEEVRQIVKEEIAEQSSHLPTKEEFYASQDKLLGELRTIRQEQIMFHHALQRHEQRFERLEDHTGIGRPKW